MSPSAALLALALVATSCGGSAAAPDPSAVAVTKVADCMKAHGMSAPNDRLDPPQPTIRGESTTLFRWCEWPPPPYAPTAEASSGGYTEIKVIRVPWAEKAEVTMASAPDRVESPCAQVELQYTFAKQSSPRPQDPIRFLSGTRALITGEPFGDSLPFRAGPTDIVVVHNLSYSIIAARCAR